MEQLNLAFTINKNNIDHLHNLSKVVSEGWVIVHLGTSDINDSIKVVLIRKM